MLTSKQQEQLWFHWQRPTKSVCFGDLYASEMFTLLTSFSLIRNKWAASEHPELLAQISINPLCFCEVERQAEVSVQRFRSGGSTGASASQKLKKRRGLEVLPQSNVNAEVICSTQTCLSSEAEAENKNPCKDQGNTQPQRLNSLPLQR